jgi:hypothetical protein
MAEASSVTAKLYEDVAQWLSTQGSPVAPTHIALDEGSMDAFTEATNALTSESTKSGLGRAATTKSLVTTTTTNDTAQHLKAFTAGESATITGAGLFNAASTGDMHMWHRYAAGAALQSTDQITETMKIQAKLGV